MYNTLIKNIIHYCVLYIVRSIELFAFFLQATSFVSTYTSILNLPILLIITSRQSCSIVISLKYLKYVRIHCISND